MFEYAETRHGSRRVRGVHFSSTEPVGRTQSGDGSKATTARVTEIMATDLVEMFEDRRLEIPADPRFRDDLRLPEKMVSPGGRVSIAASRTGDGHADRFWSLALAVRAGRRVERPALAFDPLEALVTASFPAARSARRPRNPCPPCPCASLMLSS